MFRHLMVVAALAAVCGCAPGARADTRDAFESHGDWDFFIGTIDGIERTSCIVGTRSVRTEMFLALTPDPDGDDDTILMFRNARWDIARRALDIQLHFDNDRYWTMGARGRGDYVISNWRNREHYLDMLEDLASSLSAGLKTSEGELLTSFSLKGSRAATNRLHDCFEDMAGHEFDDLSRGRDPFDGEADETDPF